MNIIEAAEAMRNGACVTSTTVLGPHAHLRWDEDFQTITGATGIGHVRFAKRACETHPYQSYPWKPSPACLLATDYKCHAHPL